MLSPLPVTSLFAALLALMLLVLSFLVSNARTKTGIALGDGSNAHLIGHIRALGNFVEYTPIGLILLALCEASGTGERLLWTIGAMLLVGRLLHAIGMISAKRPPRALGMLLTYLPLLLGAAVLLVGCFR